MDGFAYIFCKSDSVGGLGHVGFGFQTTPRGAYSFGSMDNGAAGPFAGYEGNLEGEGFRFWTDAGSQKAMLDKFKSDGYDMFKYILVRPADPLKAQDVVNESCSRNYFPAGSNCMNVAYDILTAYGVENLPKPHWNWGPKGWTESFGGLKGKL